MGYTIDYDTWQQMQRVWGSASGCWSGKKEVKAECVEITADTMDELGSAVDKVWKKYGANFARANCSLIGSEKHLTIGDERHDSFPARVEGEWKIFLGRFAPVGDSFATHTTTSSQPTWIHSIAMD